MLCHHPPKTITAASIASVLRAESNPPLNILARSMGIVTTYLGKMLGSKVGGIIMSSHKSTEL